MSAGIQSPTYEMASVLFTDIVGYSLRSIEEQTELLTALQTVVRGCSEYKAALDKQEVLSLPTGDGMALVFLRDPVSPAKCALEIAHALRSQPQIKLRMGLHIGPVHRHADIRENTNVVGGGINMAQRVMDCGDAGHILLSRQVAEVLEQLREWKDSLHDLGVQEVKHGVKIHIYNLYKGDLGNPALPKKLSHGPSEAPPASATPPQQPIHAAAPGGGSRKWAMLALALLLAGGAAAIWFKTDLFTSRASSTSVTTPERELDYYIMVQKYRFEKPFEQPFRLSGERVFERDYRIQIVLSSPQRGYLYVLNEGPQSTAEKPDLNTLFPSPKTNSGSPQLDPGKNIEIPSGGYFVFDRQKGKEKLWLVWAAEPVPELDALKTWVNERDRGAVTDVSQARTVLTLLQKFGAASANEVNQMTTLKGKSNVFARAILLDHD